VAVDKLNAALNAAVATPEMREELRKRGFVAMGGTPQELAKWTAIQPSIWGPVLQAAGIKPE
jgi:tripartite-type tricarboxylate transporter receptor subunit TctC